MRLLSLITALMILLPITVNTSYGISDDTKDCNDNDEYLYSFSCGRLVTDDDGKGKIREFTLIIEENKIINITSEGQQFDAWTYNGTIPGPTLRMTEGDNVRITLVNPVF